MAPVKTVVVGKQAADNGAKPVSRIGGELGLTGLRHWGGRLDEEFLTELKYDKALKIYREMGDNDPTVGAAFNAITWLMRQVKWWVEGDEPDVVDERVELIESARVDMAHTWEDFVAECARGFLQYGWQLHECVYKVRTPENSKFPDGKIGWKRLPVRAQDTLHRWDFAPDGDVLAFIQRPAPDFKERRLPMDKLVLFRTDSIKNSPEGRSILRNAYRPWYYKKHLENIEGIGLERKLAGMPVVWGPARIFDDSATAAEVSIREYLEKVVTNIRKDEQYGVAMPLAYDENGNKLFDIQLLATGGESEVDTSKAIERYDLRILQLMLADFIQVGHGSTGSWALQDSKTELFAVAIGVFLDQIAAPLNQYAIPRLLELNGLSTEDAPQLKHGDIETPDLSILGSFLTSLNSAGLTLFPDMAAENKMREMIGLPTLTQEEWDDKQAEREAQQQAERDHEMQLTQRSQPNGTSPKPKEQSDA